MSTLRRTRAAAAAVAALLAVTAGGCGSSGGNGSDAAATPTAADPGSGAWLLRFSTAEGADGERSRAVFVSFDPATGATSVRALPALIASSAGRDEQVLEVSADHVWAVPDTGVPARQARSGKLVLYSVTDDATETLDIRAATGVAGLVARAWAFDPADPNLLRVVDADGGVWKVDLASRTAARESVLPTRAGWTFADGFDKNTGKPYIESTTSDRTDPPGNGQNDDRAVERAGGSLVRYDGVTPEGLPKPPCGFAGGFEFGSGDAWMFCADTPRITAYRAHVGGASWQAFGVPSSPAVPRTAAELTFALPPVR